jgi:ribosomal protein L1
MSKRYDEALENVNREKLYELEDALELRKQQQLTLMKQLKFLQNWELILIKMMNN